MLSALFMVTRLQRVYFCFKASMMDHHTRVPLQRETTEPDPQKRGWEERQKKNLTVQLQVKDSTRELKCESWL